ncbi:MAG: hypothetical protein HUJ76_11335, partial [Parasporobacterium sp.]|nr:hypothetical protein [Parasporobacterium sp.]
MKKRKITALLLGMVMTLSIASAATAASGHEHVFDNGICECGKYEVSFSTRIPLKDKYTKPIDETGTLETLTYKTPLFGIDETQETEKTLQVYLPYGYDPANRYNIVYLMHGGGESEYYWLSDEPVYEGTKAMGKTTKAMIDNMTAKGDMEPTIFVAPTCITGEDTNVEDWSRFAQEFRQVIVPFVESRYSTYACGDTSEENLIATRDHRAFAGFSMGSRCTVNAILMRDLDLVSWYGLYSGPDASLGGAGWEDVKAAIESFGPDFPISYLYNGNGTADFELEGHQELAYGLLDSMPDTFQNGKNWCWICFKGGSHAY